MSQTERNLETTKKLLTQTKELTKKQIGEISWILQQEKLSAPNNQGLTGNLIKLCQRNWAGFTDVLGTKHGELWKLARQDAAEQVSTKRATNCRTEVLVLALSDPKAGPAAAKELLIRLYDSGTRKEIFNTLNLILLHLDKYGKNLNLVERHLSVLHDAAKEIILASIPFAKYLPEFRDGQKLLHKLLFECVPSLDYLTDLGLYALESDDDLLNRYSLLFPKETTIKMEKELRDFVNKYSNSNDEELRKRSELLNLILPEEEKITNIRGKDEGNLIDYILNPGLIEDDESFAPYSEGQESKEQH